MLRLDFHVISIFCLHRALHKNSHVEALCLQNLCSWKNQKRKKVFGEKEKKYRPKEERKNTTLARKEKNPSWKRLAVAELHAGVQISNKEVAVKTKFAIHNVKNDVSFPFCMPCYKNMNNRLECNFESCRSICCLAPQHIFRFFHFRRGFFLCLWQLCSLLCRPPQRSTERSRLKKNKKQKNVSATFNLC